MGKIEHNQRLMIIKCMKNGSSQREVSRRLGIAKTSVRNIWQRYVNGFTLENRLSPGRPRLLSKTDERHLVVCSKRNPFLTANELSLCIPNDKKISLETCRRYLRRNNLFAHVAARKPLLSIANKRKRLAWCKAYKSWGISSWINVIFSDECRVEQYSKRRMLVRRSVGQRHLHTFVTKTVKHGGFSVTVWGAIKGNGSKVLHRCPAIVNSELYAQIIEDSLLPFLDTNTIFMQDGAPCHRSKATINFLETRNICLLSDWPPQSPDLNIIEHVWAKLKKNIIGTHPKNKDELWEILKEEWQKIDASYIVNLYESIPRRLAAVIKRKGLHTPY